MTRAPQKRRLETRARLLAVAEEITAERGYSALRAEDIVSRAGVAKGTLFSHFGDMDGLLAVLIGGKVMDLLDVMEQTPAPQTPAQITAALVPQLEFVARERVIFDILLRYSGVTAAQAEEAIAEGFLRQVRILEGWLHQMQAAGTIRRDQPVLLLAEGIQGFLNHVLAIWFCQDHQAGDSLQAALDPYVSAWLVT
jgi:AcrR family transcriptional regulator